MLLIFFIFFSFSCEIHHNNGSNNDNDGLPDSDIIDPCGDNIYEGIIEIKSRADLMIFSYKGYTSIGGMSINDLNETKDENIIKSLDVLKDLRCVKFGIGISTQKLVNLRGLENLINIKVLTIDSNESLEDISALSNITTLDGLSIKNNPVLKTLNGLNNLKEITGQDCGISNNSSLVSLEGLDNLESLKGITLLLQNNANLDNLKGLGKLKIISELYINSNPSFTTLNGLNPEIEADSLMFSSDPMLRDISVFKDREELDMDIDFRDLPALHDLTGFASLKTLKGNLYLYDTAIRDFKGFSNLETIVGFAEIGYNYYIHDFSGLENLKNIGKYIYIGDTAGIKDIKGFGAWDIGTHLIIANNNNLVKLTDLYNIHSIGGDVVINLNNSLAGCEADKYRDYIRSLGWTNNFINEGNNDKAQCN